MRPEPNAPEPNHFDELLRAARGGCPDAMGRVLQACHAFLLNLAEDAIDSDLRPKGGASDLVQDTFLEAQQGFAHFQGKSEDELRAWLRLILVHNAANFRRNYRDRAKREVGREVPLDEDRGGDAEPAAAAPVISAEQADRVRAEVARLPLVYRRVIEWRMWGGLTFEQIGAMLQCSAEAARKHWARAQRYLAARLGPEYGD
jgi:RNA polymerase sigma-70 factor, ECF subfamily